MQLQQMPSRMPSKQNTSQQQDNAEQAPSSTEVQIHAMLLNCFVVIAQYSLGLLMEARLGHQI